MLSSTNISAEQAKPADWRLAGHFYQSLNFFYSKKFGERVWKLSLDAGCGCPNRDGRLGTSGCVFCDPESFSPSRRSRLPTISQQMAAGIENLNRRYNARRFVAYFQPGSNTYGDVKTLHAAYLEALSHPEIVGLAVGTRPDCAGDEILDLLQDMACKTWVVVEYGLQTIHDRTLDLLNRGHHFDVFLDAQRRTAARGIDVGVHVILGLPGESADDQRATAQALAKLKIHSIKLHNLYVVRNTALAEQVLDGKVRLAEFAEYISYVVNFLEATPGRVVIERLCGDAPREYFIGPEWCLNKTAVRQAVEAEFRRRGTWQGSGVVASGEKGVGPMFNRLV